jgi:predicted DNA-binding transcriptional regulator YafY
LWHVLLVRADRLVATLLLLQARKRVTAADVAAELEVSVRTARRDLEALSAAGIPVYPQQGRGGGWELVGGARTDLSGLTAAEARTLFMVAGPEAAATPELKAALRKLVRALPEPFRAGAEAAATSVIVDPGGWGRTRRAQRPPMLDALHGAVADGVQVELSYADRTGRPSTRAVSPLGLAQKGGVWYLVANTDAGQRTFRVGRVTGVTRTDRPVVRPDGFDLEDAWRQVVANVDELRSPQRVDAVADAEVVPILHWMFDRQLQVGDTRGDGRVEVSIGCQAVERCVAEIAGLGARLEVLAPPEAREHLASLGRALLATYA